MARFVLLLLVVLSLVCFKCGQAATLEGVVVHRVLSGVKDGVAQTILWNMSDPDNGVSIIVVKDEALQHYFPSEGDVAVSEELERQIQVSYSEVFYQVSVRESLDSAVGYLASREVFSQAHLGATVRFQTSSSSGTPQIVMLLD